LEEKEVINLSVFDKLQIVKSFTGDPDLADLDPEHHRGRFVRLTLLGKLCRYRASEAELDHILQQLLAYFYATADNKDEFRRERKQILDEVWPWLKPRLRRNKGLVQFMREYGVYSRYFVPLLMYVPGALALCPAHGECLDIFGKPQKVPKTDKMYQFIQKDEMFAFARLRAEDAKPALEKAQRALVLGAGTLREVRQLKRFAVVPSSSEKEPWLVAYDLDAKLISYFAQVLTYSLQRYGVDFRYKDFRDDFEDPQYRMFYDVIEALGVASYYVKRLEWLLANMKHMLAPDGKIKFDLQTLDCKQSQKRKGLLCRFLQHTLIFDKFILLWESDLQPELSVKRAIRRVEKACARVGLKIDYYKYDPDNPIGVIFQCSHL
jgi:SAM-dependent methyltransferase